MWKKQPKIASFAGRRFGHRFGTVWGGFWDPQIIIFRFFSMFFQSIFRVAFSRDQLTHNGDPMAPSKALGLQMAPFGPQSVGRAGATKRHIMTSIYCYI